MCITSNRTINTEIIQEGMIITLSACVSKQGRQASANRSLVALIKKYNTFKTVMIIINTNRLPS